MGFFQPTCLAILYIAAVYLTLWPVTELGLLGLCYSSDLQVHVKSDLYIQSSNSLRFSALRDCRYALVVLHNIITQFGEVGGEAQSETQAGQGS